MLKIKDKIKAVCFDLDGTLIDTEKYYHYAWIDTMKHFGFDINKEEAFEFRSLGMPFLDEHIKNKYSDKLSTNDVLIFCKNNFAQRLEKHGLELKKGVRETLEVLSKYDLKVCLVTSTEINRAKDYLQKLSIDKYFDKIITSDKVKLGKPAPDSYLCAIEQIKINPENVIAVEDSKNGIISAYKAGLNTIMIVDIAEPDEEIKTKVCAIIYDMRELVEIINKT